MKANRTFRGLLIGGAAFVCVSGMVGPATAGGVLLSFGYSASETVSTSLDAGVHTSQSTTTFSPPVATSASTPPGAIGPGTASASGNFTGTPSMSGTASVNFAAPPSNYNTLAGNYGSGASFSGSLTYYFEILGPAGSVSVNANAVASFSTTALPDGAYGNAIINFHLTQLDSGGNRMPSQIISDSTWFQRDFLNPYGPQNVAFSPDITGSVATGYSGGFIENGAYSLFTNNVYVVDLQDMFDVAIANGGDIMPSAPGGTATFSGSIDPTFLIAPGVTNANAYSIIFSDGISNGSVSTTPLPAALPLFATGLGALGLLGWRRKRKAAAASTA